MTPVDGEVRLYDPALFSKGSAGAGGNCSSPGHVHLWGNRAHELPVLAVWRSKVRDRSGRRGGGWWAYCRPCAAKKRIVFQCPDEVDGVRCILDAGHEGVDHRVR